MRRLLFSITLTLSFCVTAGAQVRWDGGGDGISWADAANWAPNGVPGSSDDVLLDNFYVGVTYDVFLPATAVTIRRLTISPAGSTIITLTLPSANTFTSGAFTTTGGLGDYSVIINAGGAFDNRATVSAGSGTNLTIADSIRINNGGNYQHRTESGVAGWIEKLSSSPGTEDGTFTFAVPASSYTVSLGGLKFGTLNFGTDVINPVTYSVSGITPLIVRGELIINNGAIVDLGMSADITVKKTLLLLGGSVDFQTGSDNTVFNCEGAVIVSGTLTESGSGIPQIRLNGTILQNVSISGSFTGSVGFNVDNPAGITLGTAVTLPYQLVLTNGKVRTTASRLLTLVDNATVVGGSVNSFVEGPMKKRGDDDFIFPIGLNLMYAPIGISGGGGNITDEFTAEYKRGNPQSAFGMNVSGNIDHTSYVEYWNLDRNSGNTSPKSIELTVHQYSFAHALSTLLVAGFNTTQWEDNGLASFTTGPVFAPNVTGTITGNPTPLGGPFTLATSDPFVVNPLPIDLVSFDVVKVDNGKAIAYWKLAECCSPAARFELERAGEDRRFVFVTAMAGSSSTVQYSVPDTRLQTGVNYYRLKMINEDGRVTYSHVVTVLNGSKKLLLEMSPTNVSSHALLTITTTEPQQLELLITDMAGRIVKRVYQPVSRGTTTLPLPVNDLYSGIYQLVGMTGYGEKNVVRFYKQ